MGALYRDRLDAGGQLAAALGQLSLEDAIVVGLARGGVTVAAEVARRLALPLDALAVRKVGYPRQPEYALGAVTPAVGGVYLRSDEGLGAVELRRAVGRAQAEAEALDGLLHAHHPPLDLRGKTVLLVDDGLATGATMIAAVRWARARGAGRVVVGVPVAAAQSAAALRSEADDVVCPHVQQNLGAVGFWYDVFTQVENDEVLALLDELRQPGPD